MASQEEKQAYINEMVQQRGYVLDYHKIAVQQDFEFTKRTNELIEEASSSRGGWTARPKN